jgi:hypothetical protein
VAEWTRLESGRPRKGTVGSNPTLSAKQSSLDQEPFSSFRATGEAPQLKSRFTFV